ncbi:MAG: hypothetical protein WCA20_24330 [Candidatus Sulfotelmatobacter sp.]
MKRAIMLAVVAVAAVCVAQGQDVSGDWQGTLAVGAGVVRIVLHITKSPEGTLKATMDSPDQGVVGMPVDSITLDGSRLKFATSAVKGTYEGTVKNNTTITGNWLQPPNRTPLDFKKSNTPIKLVHPEAPPSDIDGTWEGQVTVPSIEKVQHLSFHIRNTGDGLIATFDDPELSVKGYPAVAVIRKGSSIKIEVPQVGGEVAAKFNKDLSVMSGDWNQTDHTYALTLRRVKEASADSQKPTTAPPPAKN